jgi:hypothetical protein
MTPPRPQKRSRGRFCGRVLPAWLSVAQRPNGALLLGHLGDMHSDQVGPSLTRMEREDIAPVAAEPYEVVEVDEPWTLVRRSPHENAKTPDVEEPPTH